jgi:hypothetical protein
MKFLVPSLKRETLGRGAYRVKAVDKRGQQGIETTEGGESDADGVSTPTVPTKFCQMIRRVQRAIRSDAVTA